MDALHTKDSKYNLIIRFKRTIVGFISPSPENMEEERIKKILQQRDEFMKWANAC